MRVAVVLVSCLVACGDNGKPAPDAPSPVSKYVYMNFEGVTLMPGDANAETNTSMFTTEPRALPPFIPDFDDREERLTSLVDEVNAILAPYDIEAVRERPVGAPYHMVIFTGNSLDTGFPPGNSGFIGRCDQTEVALMFSWDPTFDDRATFTHAHAYGTVAAVGWNAGVPMTTLPKDCMCWAGASCTWPFTEACTLAGPGTPTLPDQLAPCPDRELPATIDVAGLFLANLGAHP